MQKRRELMAQTNEPLLSVKGLKQYFPVSKKFTVRAVDNISFDIYQSPFPFPTLLILFSSPGRTLGIGCYINDR